MPDIPAEKTTDQPVELNFESIPKIMPLIDNRMYADCRELLVGPKRFSGVTFEGIAKEYQQDVREVINLLLSDDAKGIFLTGDVGTGKTSILRVVWRYLVSGLTIKIYRQMVGARIAYHPFIDGGLQGMISHDYDFITNWELVRDLRAETTIEQDKVTNHKATPFLFVDDLGRGFDDKAGWNLALQDEFFDSRWQNCLPTFISTNKTPDELRAWEGWSRIVDRLTDPSWMIMVNMGEGSRRKE